MDHEQLEELRRRVILRKTAAEVAALKAEINGKNMPVDPSLVYRSAMSVAKEAGVSRDLVLGALQRGELRARKTSRGGPGAMWAIHPDDAAAFIARYKGEREMQIK